MGKSYGDYRAEMKWWYNGFRFAKNDPTTGDKAFSQIRSKGYAEPYLADGRPIWLIGLSFDSATRRLVDCAAERRGDADVAV